MNKIVWWPVLQEHHCKCNDKYYASMSKCHSPVKKRISQTYPTLVILPLQQCNSQDYSGFTAQAKNRPKNFLIKQRYVSSVRSCAHDFVFQN